MAKERIFAVFGLGTFGSEVCKTLAEKGGKVIAVDNQAKLIERIKDVVTQAVLIDSTDEEALKTLPLETLDVAVVAIGEDLNASILTTALLKKLGIPLIISRGITDLHSRVLKQVGATEVINLEADEGRRVANRLISPDILDRIPISSNQTLAEIIAPKSIVGKSLKDLDIRKKFNINVISIKRTKTEIDDLGNPKKQEIVISPSPSETISQNDILVIVGNDKDIDELKEI